MAATGKAARYSVPDRWPRAGVRAVALLSLVLAAVPAPAAPLELDSGTRQVSLLELYTSQGCSSCPPAERWLNDWVDDARLWSRVVPVALHVDYWDSLGWRDPFASAANSERQRAYARAGRARSVYTPGFFLNGREWRGWVAGLPPRAPDSKPGRLTATVDGRRVAAGFPSGGTPLELHVAVLGSGIKTPVARGENRNRTLHQEFVALAHAVFTSRDGRWDVTLPAVEAGTAERLGIALWVSATDDPLPLQATGGWLPAD